MFIGHRACHKCEHINQGSDVCLLGYYHFNHYPCDIDFPWKEGDKITSYNNSEHYKQAEQKRKMRKLLLMKER